MSERAINVPRIPVPVTPPEWTEEGLTALTLHPDTGYYGPLNIRRYAVILPAMLSVRWRDSYVLHQRCHTNKTYKEIAYDLNVSVSRARTLFYIGARRAIRHYRRQLMDEWAIQPNANSV